MHLTSVIIKRLAASVQCTVTRLAFAAHERFRTRPSFGPLCMHARASARAHPQQLASSILLPQLRPSSLLAGRWSAGRGDERRRLRACRWSGDAPTPSSTSCRPSPPPVRPPPEVASTCSFSGEDKLYVSACASLIIPSEEKRRVSSCNVWPPTGC